MWEPTDSVITCVGCGVLFNFFTRKHHCRVCGKIYCAACSSERVRIPSMMDACVVQSPDAGLLTSAMRWINPASTFSSADPETQRVCRKCHRNVINVNRSKVLIDAILIVDELDICDWRVLRTLNTKWKTAMETLLRTWKTTGFLPPYKDPSPSQERLILANNELLSGHIAWLGRRRGTAAYHCSTSCEVLGCRCQCRSVPAQVKRLCSMFLSRDVGRLPSTSNMGEMISAIASRACRDDAIFRCIAVPICSEDSITGQKLFFAINGRDSAVGARLMKIAPAEAVLRWRKTLLWVEAMKGLADWDDAIHVEPEDWEGCSLPSQPDVTVVEILRDAMTKKRSSTNPVVIPVVCENRAGKRFVQCMMMKEDSVLADAVIQDLCAMIRALGRGENKTVMLVTYDVLPLNGKGMITLVPGCTTLGRLWSESQSITNYILENNPNDNVKTLKGRFLGSCAATSVISTLLCVGDRHLDNFCLTRRGDIFGIDYGFILGSEPLGKEFLGSSLRLTPSILEFLGGVGSVHYNLFKRVAGEVFNLCRRYINILFPIIESLVYDGVTTGAFLRRHMESAWLPSGDDISCSIHIQKTIERVSRGSQGWRDAITDTLHRFFN